MVEILFVIWFIGAIGTAIVLGMTEPNATQTQALEATVISVFWFVFWAMFCGTFIAKQE